MEIAIISRRQWGARDARSYSLVPRTRRTGFVVHYSGSSKSQTPRSIQDYHMDSRKWSDVGYNYLIDVEGHIYEGRGLDRLGAHASGHNSSTIGVCMIGTDADVTDAAKRSIRALFDWTCSQVGRDLATFGHRDFANDPNPGDNVTACPGDRLWRWVHGEPTLDVSSNVDDGEDDTVDQYLADRIIAGWENTERTVAKLEEQSSVLAHIDQTSGEALQALQAIRDGISTLIERIGSGEGGGLSKEDVREIVDTELDEQSRAGADQD